MTIDTTRPRTRRALLVGVLGATGAALAATMTNVQRVFAAGGDDGQPILVGGLYSDARTVTGLLNGTGGENVLEAHSAYGGIGVRGTSDSSYGVSGQSGTSAGVRGVTNSGYGVHGEAESAGATSVYGRKETTGAAVKGEIDAPTSHWGAVAGVTNGHGPAIIGENHSDGYGAQGRALGTGDGVFGESTQGRGGRFKGKKAQIRLQPSSATSHPSTGAAGDLFVDKSNRLWFCKGGSTWVKLA